MQDTKKAVGLSPQEAYQAERKVEIARRARAQEEEARDDINMTYLMDKLGIDTPTNSKNVNRLRIPHQTRKSELQKAIDTCILKVGFFAASAQAAFTAVTQIINFAGQTMAHTNAAVVAPVVAAEDALNIYDTIAVSAPTSHILNNEAQLVALLREEIEDEQSPAVKARLQMELDDLINYYDMVRHPVTGLDVHRYDHILLVEQINNPDRTLECDGSVCYFRPKADIASSRGIKRGISDVYNQSPEEVELTHAEVTAQMAIQPLAPAPRIA